MHSVIVLYDAITMYSDENISKCVYEMVVIGGMLFAILIHRFSLNCT